MADKNIVFEIREHLGVISKYDSGWNKELNLISWNGHAPKYDIRDWDEDHERAGRGVTLYDGEMRRLIDFFINCNNRKVVEAAKTVQAEIKERQAEFKKTAEKSEEVEEIPFDLVENMEKNEETFDLG